MPISVHRMRAVDLTSVETGYLFREAEEDDAAWKLVKTRPVCSLRPHGFDDVEGNFLPQVCTVKFDDGTERYFNPEDWIEIGFAS